MSNKLQEGFRKISEQNWLNEKFTIEDLHRGRSSPEKVSDVLYDDGKRKSIRKVSATTGLPYSSVRDILVKEMNL